MSVKRANLFLWTKEQICSFSTKGPVIFEKKEKKTGAYVLKIG